MVITYDIAVDLTPEFNRQLSPKFSVSLGDHGAREFTAKILQDGEPFAIEEGSTVSIVGKKSDGHIFAYACTYADEYVYFTIEEQMTPVSGIVTCELSIIDASDNKVGSANFTYWVEPSPVTDGEASDSDLQLFQQAIDAAAEIRDDVDAMVSTFGGPNVAETAAEMTDPGKVYVYTGNETGYTYGHWYYYDTSDSVWKSGGVYQSQGVVTDKTLTLDDVPADAKATGDALALKANTAAVTAALATKQDTLTFDSTPTENSTNPVTSGGVYTAVEDAKADAEEATAAAKEIALKAFATPTASGQLLTLTDGADGIPAKTLTLNLAPHQSGSGDPSPDNVRPISGYQSVTVTRARKNILENGLVDATVHGVTYTKTADGNGITVSGTVENQSDTRVIQQSLVLPNGTYLLSGGAEHIRLRVNRYDKDGTLINRVTNTGGDTSFVVDDTVGHIYVGVNPYPTGETVDGTVYPMIRPASFTDDTYEPYNGESYTITIPTAAGTVYGGQLTVDDDGSGTLTVDRTKAVIDGSEGVSFSSVSNPNGQAWLFTKPLTATEDSLAVLAESVCDKAVCIQDKSNSTIEATECRIVTASQGTRVQACFICTDASVTTLNALKAWLAENPYELVYPIDPVTYTLTAEQVTTLLGDNSIWMDADGTIDLVYRADTQKYIDDRISTLNANLAYIEDGTTASRAYSVGQYVLISGQLYKVAASIASGATFTVGTNVVSTTVGNELTALN